MVLNVYLQVHENDVCTTDTSLTHGIHNYSDRDGNGDVVHLHLARRNLYRVQAGKVAPLRCVKGVLLPDNDRSDDYKEHEDDPAYGNTDGDRH